MKCGVSLFLLVAPGPTNTFLFFHNMDFISLTWLSDNTFILYLSISFSTTCSLLKIRISTTCPNSSSFSKTILSTLLLAISPLISFWCTCFLLPSANSTINECCFRFSTIFVEPCHLECNLYVEYDLSVLVEQYYFIAFLKSFIYILSYSDMPFCLLYFGW